MYPLICRQDIPVHVTMLTFLLMAFDRYTHLKYPNKTRLPPWSCTFGCWILAFCIVLPYPLYTDYMNLSVSNDNLFQYNRSDVFPLFITVYKVLKSRKTYFSEMFHFDVKSKKKKEKKSSIIKYVFKTTKVFTAEIHLGD